MKVPKISEAEREEIHTALMKRKDTLEKLSKKTDEEEIPTDRIEERLALYRDRDDLKDGRKITVAGLLSIFAAAPTLSVEQRKANEEAEADTAANGAETGGAPAPSGKERWGAHGHPDAGANEPETRESRMLPGSTDEIADADFEIIDSHGTRSEDDVQGTGESGPQRARVLNVRNKTIGEKTIVIEWERGEGVAAVFAGFAVRPIGTESADPWGHVTVADLGDANELEVPRAGPDEFVVALIEPRTETGDVGRPEYLKWDGPPAPPAAATGDSEPFA